MSTQQEQPERTRAQATPPEGKPMSTGLRRLWWIFIVGISVFAMATVWWKWRVHNETRQKLLPKIDRSAEGKNDKNEAQTSPSPTKEEAKSPTDPSPANK